MVKLIQADHPRACGANASVKVLPVAGSGSSPRMRGKQPTLIAEPVNDRIIPAHAGQTPTTTTPLWARSDHPRACGANVNAFPSNPEHCGSSPRMRGKPACIHMWIAALRIIPAHAGQTWLCRWVPAAGPDHPRACGANQPMRPQHPAVAGSSPRMRGKRRVRAAPSGRGRIIPAHAGQT